MILRQVIILIASLFAISSAFLTTPPTCRNSPSSPPHCLKMGSAETIDAEKLYDATKRRQFYQQNIAQFLVDLSDSRATFDFCGGMMFEFKLSDKLRARLLGVSSEGSASLQPTVADSSKVSELKKNNNKNASALRHPPSPTFVRYSVAAPDAPIK